MVWTETIIGIVGIGVGALVSYLATRHYYKRTGKDMERLLQSMVNAQIRRGDDTRGTLVIRNGKFAIDWAIKLKESLTVSDEVKKEKRTNT